jgi:hypothetical protein
VIEAMLAAVALSAAPSSLQPRPIGIGPRYRPPTRAVDGRPFTGFRCARGGDRFGVHLEVFAHRRVVIVPAAIGVAPPFAVRFGRVVPRACTYDARTLAPTGVFEIRRGSRLTVGDLFRLWGQPLARTRLAGFRSARQVLAFVGGRRWRGDPRAIPLRRHAQIVLEIGGYVAPHPSFLFPEHL